MRYLINRLSYLHIKNSMRKHFVYGMYTVRIAPFLILLTFFTHCEEKEISSEKEALPKKTIPIENHSPKKIKKIPPTTNKQTTSSKDKRKKKASHKVYRVVIKGAITPSATENLNNALYIAKKNHAEALIVIMDTPGGLMNSMDDMIRNILRSEVPVLTYISPPGAACGSAGVYIMYASHVAAMAPATNIGSATPVSVGGGASSPEKGSKKKKEGDRIPKVAGTDDAINMKRKLINHSRAQIRSLAQFHGRNAIFAEKTITQAINMTSKEAYKIKAIDILAPNEASLLKQVDGRIVRMSSGSHRLSLKDAKIITIKKDFRQSILDLIANPNLAHILMMLGILGIIAEIQSPGLIFPGAIGAISLCLGLYAMQTLSLSYTALGLLGLGFIFFLLEIYIMSYGLLSIAGILSLLLGSLMLVRNADEFTSLSLVLILSVSLFTGVLLSVLIYLVTKSQKAKPASGYEKLIEETAIAKTIINEHTGFVFIHGEVWQARADQEIAPKTSVRIISRKGLLLFVEAV